MNLIEEALQKTPVLIIVGAMATELEARGCDLNDALWSAKVLLEQPELIRAVHLDYFNNGADIAITASYQATIEGFSKRGLSEEEAIALIQKSVRLAVAAGDEFWETLRTVSEDLGRLSRLPSAHTAPIWQTDRSTVEIMVYLKAS